MNVAAFRKMAVRLTIPTISLLLPVLALAMTDAPEAIERIDSDTDRIPLHTVIPDYPRIARRDRIEGEVQVCFNITRDGRPTSIAVRRSTNRMFERPARKAVRKSTWVPLASDQPSAGIKACRTFRFSLVPVSQDEQD